MGLCAIKLSQKLLAPLEAIDFQLLAVRSGDEV